jgi:hypothetical protein
MNINTRLSEFLRKGLIQSFYGGITYRLHIKTRRRVTLFFGDIFMNYLKACENAGLRNEMVSIGQEWMFLAVDVLVPSAMKKLPLSLLNMSMKKVWVGTGLMDDFNIEKKDDVVTIRTKNEVISKNIGENGFSVGLYMGLLNSLYGKAKTVRVKQTERENVYEFRLTGERYNGLGGEGKGKSEYVRLNVVGNLEGMTLEYALKNKILELKEGNRLFFRGRPLYPVENTVFHIIGNQGILLEKVSSLSYEFFRPLVSPEAPEEKMLMLLKTLLQAAGWGIVKIAIRSKRIEIDIECPPFGMQKENDNWEFLIKTILGYLWLIDKGFRIKESSERNRLLRIVYSRK